MTRCAQLEASRGTGHPRPRSVPGGQILNFARLSCREDERRHDPPGSVARFEDGSLGYDETGPFARRPRERPSRIRSAPQGSLSDPLANLNCTSPRSQPSIAGLPDTRAGRHAVAAAAPTWAAPRQLPVIARRPATPTHFPWSRGADSTRENSMNSHRAGSR